MTLHHPLSEKEHEERDDMQIILAIMTVFLLLTPMISHGGLRCGRRLVAIGDTKADIQVRCGKPDLITKEKMAGARSGRGSKKRPGSTTVETWTYNMGEKRLIKILRFEGSRLVSTEQGGYGTGPTRQSK